MGEFPDRPPTFEGHAHPCPFEGHATGTWLICSITIRFSDTLWEGEHTDGQVQEPGRVPWGSGTRVVVCDS